MVTAAANSSTSTPTSSNQNRLLQEWREDFGYDGLEAHANLGLRTHGLEGSGRPYTVANDQAHSARIRFSFGYLTTGSIGPLG